MQQKTVPSLWEDGKDIPLPLFQAFMQDNDPVAYDSLITLSRAVIIIADLPRLISIQDGIVKPYKGAI